MLLQAMFFQMNCCVRMVILCSRFCLLLKGKSLGELNLAAEGRNNDSKPGGPHSGERVLNLTGAAWGSVSDTTH